MLYISSQAERLKHPPLGDDEITDSHLFKKNVGQQKTTDFPIFLSPGFLQTTNQDQQSTSKYTLE